MPDTMVKPLNEEIQPNEEEVCSEEISTTLSEVSVILNIRKELQDSLDKAGKRFSKLLVLIACITDEEDNIVHFFFEICGRPHNFSGNPYANENLYKAYLKSYSNLVCKVPEDVFALTREQFNSITIPDSKREFWRARRFKPEL